MMVTYCEQRKITNDDLLYFLNDSNCMGVKLRLLLFWGRHPQTKFSLDSISNALNVTRTSLIDIIEVFVEKDIVKEQFTGSGITTYSLNDNPQIQEYIKSLTNLKMIGWHLEEDDHFLLLKDRDKVVAIWSATGVTIDEIQNEANRLEKQLQREAILV